MHQRLMAGMYRHDHSYKRDPRDFIVDTIVNGMTLEESGAYALLIDLAMDKDGSYRFENDKILGRVLRCSARKAATIREKFVAHGLMRTENGVLFLTIIDRWRAKQGREPISRDLRTEILERDSWTCVYCGTKDCEFHIDHVIPVSRGGTNDPENLAAACKSCNLSKSDKLVSELQH